MPGIYDDVLDQLAIARKYPRIEFLPLKQIIFCLPKTSELYSEALNLVLPNLIDLPDDKREWLQDYSTTAVRELVNTHDRPKQTLWVIEFFQSGLEVSSLLASENVPFIEFTDRRDGQGVGYLDVKLRMNHTRQFTTTIPFSPGGMMDPVPFKNVGIIQI